jgi:hypothetical protein
MEGGRKCGGHDGGIKTGLFQDGKNEGNISTALVEYDADDAHFVDACGYVLQQVSKVHRPAQLE